MQHPNHIMSTCRLAMEVAGRRRVGPGSQPRTCTRTHTHSLGLGCNTGDTAGDFWSHRTRTCQTRTRLDTVPTGTGFTAVF
jgi:hypothetical protein